MSERFGLLKKGMGALKKAVEPANQEEAAILQAMDEQRDMKNIGQRLIGGQIPQRDMPNQPKQLKPYKSEYINRPGTNLDSMARADEHVAKMNDAVKQRQLEELADLEMMGEFDTDPNSDIQQKIKRLKSVLGQ